MLTKEDFDGGSRYRIPMVSIPEDFHTCLVHTNAMGTSNIQSERLLDRTPVVAISSCPVKETY